MNIRTAYFVIYGPFAMNLIWQLQYSILELISIYSSLILAVLLAFLLPDRLKKKKCEAIAQDFFLLLLPGVPFFSYTIIAIF